MTPRSTATRPSSDRVWFAHAARGIAASTVVWFHLGETFILRHMLVAKVAYGRPLEPVPEPAWMGVSRWLTETGFSWGSFGVALFFLISGFVIPFSLERLSLRGFFVRRVLRIYPLYILSLVFLMLVLRVHAVSTGMTLSLSWRRIISNALLLHAYLGEHSIDEVNWTLAIEELFYAFASLAFATGWLSKERWLTGLCLMVTTCSLLSAPLLPGLPFGPLRIALSALAYNGSYLPYMLVGTSTFFCYRGSWSTGKALRFGAVSFAAFVACTLWGPLVLHGARSYVATYGAALMAFVALFALRNRMRPDSVLDWLARISFPLYLVHGLNGYVLLFILNRWLGMHLPSLLVVLSTVYLVAWLLHRWVEAPLQDMARRLSSSPLRERSPVASTPARPPP
jgi:peptidoglycan/LPS O-acetylase OafA/YrhL